MQFERTKQDCLESYFGVVRQFDEDEELDFRLACRADFAVFFEHVIGLGVGEYHKILFSLLDNRRICLLSPRGHAKTEIFSVAYTLWKAAYNPHIRIVIVSNTDRQAQRIIERIKKKIQTNELLKDLTPVKGNNRYLWSKTKAHISTGAIIIASPLTDAIRGERIDLCICDDLLKKELSDQSKTSQDFHDIVEPATDTEGSQLIVVGTTVSKHDLFHELAQEGTGYVFRKFTCCKAIENGKLVGPVLFPERWTLEKLQQQYNSMGPTSFRKEYMSDPILTGELIFSAQLVDSATDNELAQLNAGRSDCEYWLGVDIALSKLKTADRTAFIIIEKQPADQTLRVVRVEQPSRGTYTDQLLERIKELHRQFKFKQILVENKGNSMSLVEFLQRDEETMFATEEFKTTHKEKERILYKVQSKLKTGHLKLINVAALINELKSMGLKGKFQEGRFVEKLESLTGHDDTVMALALATEAATTKVGQVGAVWI